MDPKVPKKKKIKGSGNFFLSLPRKVRRKTIVPKQYETARFYTAQPQGPFLERNRTVLDKI